MKDMPASEEREVAVDLSNGQLKVFLGRQFVTDELLKYIADRYLSCVFLL